MPQPPSNLKEFHALVKIIADLRGPDGCPWDKEQTHQSLAPYAIEEVHEMVEAIESADDKHMCEELGDVLFQVVLHSQLAEERKTFSITDVIQGISEKIVRRHPHVFAATPVSGTAEVLKNWDEIKKLEKLNNPRKVKVIDVPAGLPALQRAHDIGEKTQKLKFDWTAVQDVLAQLKAEIIELEEAMLEDVSPDSFSHIQHEMGDVLFSAAQLSRHLEIEPESCLRQANRRFLSRFDKMLEIGKITAEQFKNLSANEKEKLWSDAKKEC
ncbi:MAG: nucleoside triphosphate pyrophosphohydrolase [Bdellovibrionales bacterium RIFCSPHIGHO2_01_FULL_40_29]|nr:MAG: nucleoside triphosphate pyrophosphohydrolase [Bdellovibrionales bacterium RIFCSPHIGHO2_01_FULL_40_29]OFZ32746.1 MAG: nucleoside triphosphate pyrophosphohydrolase [Bdellovibrionales bacterium RIFCSPHIGHO2_02_FULL_40_15]